jgi:hypothetical protein
VRNGHYEGWRFTMRMSYPEFEQLAEILAEKMPPEMDTTLEITRNFMTLLREHWVIMCKLQGLPERRAWVGARINIK